MYMEAPASHNCKIVYQPYAFAAGSKKKRSKSPADKAKSRARNQKSKGKRGASKSVSSDGFAPLMKKKPKT